MASFAADSMSIDDVVPELMEWWHQNQPSLYQNLQAAVGEQGKVMEVVEEYNRILKKRAKITLPPDLIQLWCLLNGSRDQFIFATRQDSATLLDIQSSLDLYTQEYTCSDEDDTNDDKTVFVPDGWANIWWVPFGWIPNGGELFLDIHPGPHGLRYQLVENDSEGGFIVLAASLQQYLTWLLKSLNCGDVVFDGRFPTAKDSHFPQQLFTATPRSSMRPLNEEKGDDADDNDSEEEDNQEVTEETPSQPATTEFKITLRIAPGKGRVAQEILISHPSINLQCKVRQLKDYVHSFLCSGTLDDASANVWAGEGLPAQRQVYLYSGAMLPDTKTLQECKVQANSILSVSIRP